MITRLTSSAVTQGLPKYRSMLAGNPYYIPPSFESIATATGTGSSATITFSSIPATYSALQIRGIGRSTQASASFIEGYIYFNSDTSLTTVTYHALVGNGSTAVATGWGTNTDTMQVIKMSQGSMSAGIMGVNLIDIHNYASTTQYKTVRAFHGGDANGSGDIRLMSGLWLNTNAINSITISTVAGNFTTDSTFALYGIKGA